MLRLAAGGYGGRDGDGVPWMHPDDNQVRLERAAAVRHGDGGDEMKRCSGPTTLLTLKDGSM